MRVESIGGVQVRVGAEWSEPSFDLRFTALTRCVEVHPGRFIAEVALGGVVLIQSKPVSDRRAALADAKAALTRRFAEVLALPTGVDDQ